MRRAGPLRQPLRSLRGMTLVELMMYSFLLMLILGVMYEVLTLCLRYNRTVEATGAVQSSCERIASALIGEIIESDPDYMYPNGSYVADAPNPAYTSYPGSTPYPIFTPGQTPSPVPSTLATPVYIVFASPRNSANNDQISWDSSGNLEYWSWVCYIWSPATMPSSTTSGSLLRRTINFASSNVNGPVASGGHTYSIAPGDPNSFTSLMNTFKTTQTWTSRFGVSYLDAVAGCDSNKLVASNIINFAISPPTSSRYRPSLFDAAASTTSLSLPAIVYLQAGQQVGWNYRTNSAIDNALEIWDQGSCRN
jgi:hypothetical protein